MALMFIDLMWAVISTSTCWNKLFLSAVDKWVCGKLSSKWFMIWMVEVLKARSIISTADCFDSFFIFLVSLFVLSPSFLVIFCQGPKQTYWRRGKVLEWIEYQTDLLNKWKGPQTNSVPDRSTDQEDRSLNEQSVKKI